MSKGRRHHRPLSGRHFLTIGPLALMGLSVYELWVRMDDFWAWISGIRHLSEVRETPFLEDVTIVFEVPLMRAMLYKLLFLALCVIFAVICLFRRNHSRGAWALFAGALGLTGLGVWMGVYGVKGWTQLVKFIPLTMIAAGCVWNWVQRRIRVAQRHHHHTERPPEEKAA